MTASTCSMVSGVRHSLRRVGSMSRGTWSRWKVSLGLLLEQTMPPSSSEATASDCQQIDSNDHKTGCQGREACYFTDLRPEWNLCFTWVCVFAFRCSVCSRITERLIPHPSDSGSMYRSHNSLFSSDSEGNNLDIKVVFCLCFQYFGPNHVYLKAFFFWLFTLDHKV